MVSVLAWLLPAAAVSWLIAARKAASACLLNRLRTMRIDTLKKRNEFTRIAKQGGKYATPTVIVQHFNRPDMENDVVRIGFTVTRKLGNAVIRNRIKRRLREAVRAQMPKQGVPGKDYVFIGRSQTLDCAYAVLLNDVERALKTAGKAK